MAFGIKVSKSGKEAGSPLPSDLIIDTNYENLKIAKTGSGSFSHIFNSYTDYEDYDTIPHILGATYVPIFTVFVKNWTIGGSETGWMQAPFVNGTPGGQYHQVCAYWDSTYNELVISFILDYTVGAPNPLPSVEFKTDYKYYIFGNKLE